MTLYNVDFSTENSHIVEVERVFVLLNFTHLRGVVVNSYVLESSGYDLNRICAAMPCSHDKLGCNSLMSVMYVFFHWAVL